MWHKGDKKSLSSLATLPEKKDNYGARLRERERERERERGERERERERERWWERGRDRNRESMRQTRQKSETRMSASVIKQDPSTYKFQKTAIYCSMETTELNQKRISVLALHFIFHRFLPFNCYLSVVL